MDLAPIQIATASNAAISGILAVALSYLWRLRPAETAPAWWAAALLVFALRQVVVLATPGSLPPPTVLAGLTGALPFVLFYAGALRFLEHPAPSWRLYALAAAIVMSVLVTFGGSTPFFPGLWIVVGLVALVSLLTSLLFLRAARAQSETIYGVLGVLFCVWSLWVLIYPWFGPTETGRAWYAVPTALLAASIGVSLIIAVQRRLHLRALHAQNELAASNQRFQDFVDTASAWIWEMDAEQRIRFISPQVFDSLGLRPETFIGHRFDRAPGIASCSLSEEDHRRIYSPDRPFSNIRITIVTTAGRRARIAHNGKPIVDGDGRHIGFRGISIDTTRSERLETTLEAVTGALSHSVGPDYFRLLVEHLTADLGADYAMVGQRVAGGRIRTLASFGQGVHQPEKDYEIEGTPCAVTLAQHLCVVDAGVADLYPQDRILAELGIAGYAGVSLRNAAGEAIGLIVVMNRERIADSDLIRTVLSAIAARAGAELERQAAETALRDSEELFRTVIDHMPVGFHLTDLQGRFVMRNQAMDEWSRVSRSEALGRTHRELALRLPFDATRIELELREAIATRQPVIRERVDRHRDGQERPLLVCRYPVLGSDGTVRYVASLLTDLTEVKRLEAEILEREKLFRTVIDNMPMAFQITDPDTRVILANRTLQDWHGCDEASLIGRTLRESGHSAAVFERIAGEIRDVVSAGRTTVYEGVFASLRGDVRPALISRFPIFDSDGKVSLIGSVAADLTEVKNLQRQVQEREALFRAVIDNTPMAFQITDGEGRLVMANRTLQGWMGHPEAELIGRTFRENGLSPASCDRIERELREVMQRGQGIVGEGVFEAVSGQTRPALVYRFPLFDEAGKVKLIGTVGVDLTEMKQLQRQAEEHEARFRALIDNMPIGFHLMDPQGRYLLRNRTLESWSMAGEPGRFIGRTLQDVANSPEYAYIEAEFAEILASRAPIIRERDFIGLDGSRRPALVCRFPLFDSDGAISSVATFITDLSGRRLLEAQVREREALFRAVVDNMPIGFHLSDAQGRFVMRNRALESWSDPAWRAQPGEGLHELARRVPFDVAEIEAEQKEVLATRLPVVRERSIPIPGGLRRPTLILRFPILDPAGEVAFVGSLLTDLTDLKHLESEISRSEARLQRVVAALDRSQKGVIVEDSDKRPIYINRTAGELMGAEASASAMLERAGIGAELEAHGSWAGEVIHRTRSGRDAILQANISRLPDGGAVTLLDDATERLERERRQVALERQVQEAQKMDAVGQLAGGIAHDFNNLIGAILGFSRFIAEDTDPASPVHGYATRILSASQRARELIQQMLSFSRRENAPRQPASLAQLVEESAQLLRATLPSTLTIDVRNDFPEAWSIVNPTQVTQILVNLCLNAADAMGGQPGTLTLALERLPEVDPRLRNLIASDPGSLPRLDLAADPDGPSCCYVGALRAGCPYLVLSVRDEGSGIAPDILAKIFDPFFTTKPRGQGTGLGLAVVQRLILAHDGALVVTTRPGHGTSFDVILPVSGRSSRDVVEAINATGATPSPRPSPKGRILVVDDDLHFGDMVSNALDRAGYEVGVCGRPREALDVFAEQPGLWDVVVTDQTMPEMSGLEMIGRLKSLNPKLRCVLCTGYASSSLNAATAQAGGADVFFHKPVDLEALIAAIQGLPLAAQPSGTAS